MPGEEWKDLPGYEGSYQVSNEGRIKSLPKKWQPRYKILKYRMQNKGYASIVFCINQVRVYKLVHVLVASLFIKNDIDGLEVNHRDGDKWNNRVSNLEWGTHQANAEHAFRTGLNKNFGENHHNSKITPEIVRDILCSARSSAEMAQKYGIQSSVVCAIRKGKSWKRTIKNLNLR